MREVQMQAGISINGILHWMLWISVVVVLGCLLFIDLAVALQALAASENFSLAPSLQQVD